MKITTAFTVSQVPHTWMWIFVTVSFFQKKDKFIYCCHNFALAISHNISFIIDNLSKLGIDYRLSGQGEHYYAKCSDKTFQTNQKFKLTFTQIGLQRCLEKSLTLLTVFWLELDYDLVRCNYIHNRGNAERQDCCAVIPGIRKFGLGRSRPVSQSAAFLCACKWVQ